MYLVNSQFLVRKYLREKVPLSLEELENRADLFREWTLYKTKQHTRDLQMIDRIDFAQERALNQLLKVSPELYTKAVQVSLPLELHRVFG